jgi:hypothetical protein
VYFRDKKVVGVFVRFVRRFIHRRVCVVDGIQALEGCATCAAPLILKLFWHKLSHALRRERVMTAGSRLSWRLQMVVHRAQAL